MRRPAGEFFDMNQRRDDKERILLVEGLDDAYFFDTILHDLRANPEIVGILVIDGSANIASELTSFTKSAPFVTKKVRSFAVVLDADENPAAAHKSVSDALKRCGMPVPMPGAWTDRKDIPSGRVGLFLLPGAGMQGNLDDVCLDAVKSATLLGSVNKFFTDISSTTGALDKLSKRKVQTYLAGSQGELCRGAGRGFREGNFDRNAPSLSPIKEFCDKLIR